jgi:hypothetical protein
MSVTTNYRVRFCENNIASSTYLTDYSSQNSTYPASNVFDINRSKKWVSNFCFVIDASNNKIYINDGINKTITLTSNKYSANSLATHITTQLNASSANWTCSYNSTTYLFTIANTGSVTLRLSQTTSSTWNILGYLLPTDQIGTSFVGQAPRIHSEEYFHFDFQVARPVDFVALISPIDEEFGISQGATITLEGSNLGFWAPPAMSVNIPVTELGAFKFIDDQTSSYRYFRLRIFDPMNTTGKVSFSHLYLGDYETISDRNVNIGFDMTEIDPSKISDAMSGKRYADEDIKYTVMNALGINNIELVDRDKLYRMWSKLGLTKPFYISLDPTECVSTSIKDLTKFVYFNSQPSFVHIIYKIWSTSFSVREVI